MKVNQNLLVNDFSNAKLEFRFEGDNICIYGTEGGFRWFIERCEELINNPKIFLYHNHIDRSIPPEVMPRVLTDKSLEAIVFIFTSQENCQEEKPKQKNWKRFFEISKKPTSRFDGDLEFRLNTVQKNTAVDICGTQKGLMWLIEQCKELTKNTRQSHIHIDIARDICKFLTKQSLNATIAIFSPTEKHEGVEL